MKLAGFDIYHYTLPFTEPAILKGTQLHSREGFLLELTDENGISGWGETSPLPGFSQESLDEAGCQLRELAASSVESTGSAPICVSDDLELAPSVRFGFELALWNLYAASQGNTLPEMLSERPAASIPLNGLLAGTEEHVLEEAHRMLDVGYEAVKLKVGAREVREDADLVSAVVEVLGNAVTLRLDANRAWSFEEAVEFFRATQELRFEYIEEPLARPEGLTRLVEEYGVPVALDESLVGMEPEELHEHRYAKAIVLKPTLLGSISRALRLAREAGRLGIVPVVSSAYETGIGTSALVSLSASIANGSVPAGLDTYRRLAADVLEPALDLTVPRVCVKEMLDRHLIDRSRLERVYSSES